MLGVQNALRYVGQNNCVGAHSNDSYVVIVIKICTGSSGAWRDSDVGIFVPQ